MIRIEVTADVIVKTGNARATGKPYEIKEQVAFAHLIDKNGKPSKYPARILLRVNRDAEPLPSGDYTLAPESFYVGDFGALALSPVLRPIQAVKAAA